MKRLLTVSYDARSQVVGVVNGWGQSQSYAYDGNGNTTSTTDRDWVYGDPNRLQATQILGVPLARYVYNGSGQRVRKDAADTTLYYYDPNGQLLAELEALGATQREYLYLEGLPLALVRAGPTPTPDPAEQLLDNTDPSTGFAGVWPLSTAVSGYAGANYQTHAANGPRPGGLVIDNSDPGFSVTGNWPTSTAVSGYQGAHYQHHFANGPSPAALGVDNTDPGFSASGAWTPSTAVSGYLYTNYQAHAAGTGQDPATWTFPVPTAGDYQIYARWTPHSNRASNAAYTITHSDGLGGTTTTTVTVNQQTHGGSDNLLGTFPFAPGPATVTLSDAADGYVIADAVQLVPPGAPPNTATWSFTAPTAGDYQVYARWTPHSNRASNAPYTIAHSDGLGGTTRTTVTVNQQTHGGIDNLLGVFRFDAGPATVTLSDAADGYVIADAVQLVPPGAGPNTVTWTPQLTQSAEYEVLAQWTSHPNRATNAQYIITHVNGTDTITVNQQQNGGTFNSLGIFTLDQNSTIQLSDEANGYVIADAVKISRTTTPPPAQDGIYYYVNDHLGTPQVITDNNQQVVWQADYEPFGRATITTETLTNNLRFPGQYFDAESGLYHNGFRPYDPGTGRYIQSDPIGLAGGLNTYAYVLGNPFRYTDPWGLWSTEAHDYLIRKYGELNGLTDQQVKYMMRGSAYADTLGFQDAEHSFMHAMSSESLSQKDACERANQYIRSNLQNPKNFMKRGMGLHAVMDSTSPSHQGFQLWNSDQTRRHGPDSILGIDRKYTEEGLSALLINPELLAKTLDLMDQVTNYGVLLDCSCYQ